MPDKKPPPEQPVIVDSGGGFGPFVPGITVFGDPFAAPAATGLPIQASVDQPQLPQLTVIGFHTPVRTYAPLPPPAPPAIPFQSTPYRPPPPAPAPGYSPGYQPPTDLPPASPGTGIEPSDYLEPFQGKPLPEDPMLQPVEVSAPRGGSGFGGLAFLVSLGIIGVLEQSFRPLTAAQRAVRNRIKYPNPFKYLIPQPDYVSPPEISNPTPPMIDYSVPDPALQLEEITVIAPRPVEFYEDRAAPFRDFVSVPPMVVGPAGSPRVKIGPAPKIGPGPRPGPGPQPGPGDFPAPGTKRGPHPLPPPATVTPEFPMPPPPPPKRPPPPPLTFVSTPPVTSTSPGDETQPTRPGKRPPKPPVTPVGKGGDSGSTGGGPGSSGPGPGGGGVPDGTGGCDCPGQKSEKQKRKYGCEQGYYTETRSGIKYRTWSTRKCPSSKTSSRSPPQGRPTTS